MRVCMCESSMWRCGAPSPNGVRTSSKLKCNCVYLIMDIWYARPIQCHTVGSTSNGFAACITMLLRFDPKFPIPKSCSKQKTIGWKIPWSQPDTQLLQLIPGSGIGGIFINTHSTFGALPVLSASHQICIPIVHCTNTTICHRLPTCIGAKFLIDMCCSKSLGSIFILHIFDTYGYLDPPSIDKSSSKYQVTTSWCLYYLMLSHYPSLSHYHSILSIIIPYFAVL